ncbi:MAG: hypothetical protein ACLGHY_05560, partial [Gammaproteobacteria bacterium]
AAEFFAPEALIPPQFVGLGAAIFGMVAGSLAPGWMGGEGDPDSVPRSGPAPAMAPADAVPTGGQRTR